MQEILLELEPEIRSVAAEGARFQGQVEALAKSDTGSRASDLVTEADYWVQRKLLELFINSPLVECQLVAEETSPELAPLMARFAERAPYQLLLDPIDGTKRFLEGLPYFSTIVSLRDAQRCHYTFCYYPKLNWWFRALDEASWEFSGRMPLDLPVLDSQSIVYTSGNPDQDFSDWRGELPTYTWTHGEQVHPCGSKLLYLAGAVAGYACSKPNLYDGLMIYHYAKVRRHKILEASSQGEAELNFSQWSTSPRGLHLGGRYLCLQAGN